MKKCMFAQAMVFMNKHALLHYSDFIESFVRYFLFAIDDIIIAIRCGMLH